MLPEAELSALADDIARNGMQVPPLFWKDPKTGVEWLVDGRNRLEAMQRIGLPVVENGKLTPIAREGVAGTNSSDTLGALRGADPTEVAISANIARRHLSEKERVFYVKAARKAGAAFAQPQRQVDSETTGEASPVVSTVPAKTGPRKAGVSGSLPGETGEVARLADVDRKTARKYVREYDELEAAGTNPIETLAPQPKPPATPAAKPGPSVSDKVNAAANQLQAKVEALEKLALSNRLDASSVTSIDQLKSAHGGRYTHGDIHGADAIAQSRRQKAV